MAEEIAKEDTVTADAVTDESLSAAWEGTPTEEKAAEAPKEEVEKEAALAKEEPAAETPPAEEQQASEAAEAEKLTQQESSRLGRKVHGINERIKQLEAQISAMNEHNAKNPVQMPEVVTTPEDIEKVLYLKAQREQQATAEYQRDYLTTVQGLSDNNKDIHDEVFAEMMQNHNVRYSPNGFADARINYAEAKAAVLARKLKTAPTLPKREVSKTAPVQPAASSTKAASKVASVPKNLDPVAQDYVNWLRRQGVSEDEIASQLA
jgi:hypothetical protein